MTNQNIVTDKAKAIAAINVLQPISRESLLIQMGMEPNRLEHILAELKSEGLICEETGNLRVTVTGLKLSVSKDAKKLRDVYRMKYLLKISKAKGR